MSFRDFSPRGNPQGQPQTRKSPLRRAASNTARPSPQRMDSLQYSDFSRSKSENSYPSYRNDQSLTSSYHGHNDTLDSAQQSLLVQQREEEYALRVMQQREEEMRDIHRKMNVVNEIYKDLGEVVDQQQEQIDAIEDKFGNAADATRRGMEQIEKANKTHKKVAADTEQDGIGERASEKRKQFFLLHYLSKSASEIAKLARVCGGGSADYVDKSNWKT